MINKRSFSDESGLTVAFETILLFAISVLFLGMIYFSFHDMNQRQNKILMEEELITIGNTIAKQMSDLTIEARASNKLGSRTRISSEFWIPETIADSPYRVTLTAGKILLESTSTPYISVEVPVNSDINLADNSTLYSNDGKYTMEYDSQSSAIYFANGGVVPFPDFNPPTLSITAPAENSTIEKSTYINVTVWDDVGVTRVEYYVDGSYRYSAGTPYNWLWNTLDEADGYHTVTAVAYDAAGHTKPASRNYTIYNPYYYAPVITIISPSDGENTTFKKPIIKADITDDKALDFSSIELWIGSQNLTSNITLSSVPPKKTTLTYTPTENMAVGEYMVRIYASDLNATPLRAEKNWTFNITAITDAALPLAYILQPNVFTPLEPGTPIVVTYLAYDLADSGIDNLTIKVGRSDGVLYTYFEQVSIYPNVVYSIDPQETWTFNTTYSGGMNYTYNITIFDRYGRSALVEAGPFSVALPGQASELEVDYSGNSTTGGGKNLKNINIKDNISDAVYPTITKMNVYWVSNSTEKIESVKIGGATYWSGSSLSGSQLTLSPQYTTSSAFKSIDMTFSTSIKNKTFTIVFLFSDSTTSSVTFFVPP